MKAGRDRLIKIKVILEKGNHCKPFNFLASALGQGSVSFCLGWTGLASLPAKSLVWQMEIRRVGQGPDGERPEEDSSREVLYLSQPAEGQLSTICTHLRLGKEPFNVWDWEEVSPSLHALIIPLMGSKLRGSSLSPGKYDKVPRTKLVV